MQRVTGSIQTTIAIASLLLASCPLGVRRAAAAAPQHQWSQRFGGPGFDQGVSIATDHAGNVIIAGSFQGTVNFGGSDLVSAGGDDVVLAKYSALGFLLWSQRLGGTDFDDLGGVAVDDAGNIVLGGFFRGTSNFGGSDLVSNGKVDMFLARYDANGVHQWSRSFGGANPDDLFSVAVDGSGNIFTTGLIQSSVDLGGGPLPYSGITDTFIAKYNSLGQHQWSHSFGGAYFNTGYSVATDAGGSVVMVGEFMGAVNFGGATLTSAGDIDMFIAKFDSNGVHQWSKRFGSTNTDSARSVAVDGSGSITMTGWFGGTVNFGGADLVGTTTTNLFVARYSATGAHQWSQHWQGTDNLNGMSVAVDNAGNTVLMGAFKGTVDFGGGNIVSNDPSVWDIFIAKFDGAGANRWSRGFGTEQSGPLALALDDLGHVCATGSFKGSMNVGGADLASAGSADMFIAKFGTDAAVSGVEDSSRPGGLALTAYPNPFNPSTTIRFTMPERSRAVLRIYEVSGKLVTTLVDQVVEEGQQERVWDGKDLSGSSVSSGVYFYRLTTGGRTLAKKMILMK